MPGVRIPASVGATVIAIAVSGLLVVAAAGQAEATGPTMSGTYVPAWQKRLIDAAKPTPAGVRIRVNASESPVEAATLPEFTRAVAAQQRQESVGSNGMRGPNSSSWRLVWNWEMESHLGQCQFKQITVTVEYNADFATLSGPVAADSAAQVWWTARQEQTFAGRVKTLKVLRDGAKGIAQKMRMMQSNTCGDLATRANDIGRNEVREVYQQALETHMESFLDAGPPIPPRPGAA
jgi:predicted secreted Zn-dependent protease